MKLLLILGAVSAFCEFAIATPTPPTVNITSFARVGDLNSQMGEVCGNVQNANGNTVNLNVIADYETRVPGEYHTFSGTDGNFCQVIRTLNGTVNVTIVGQAQGASSLARISK